MNNSEQEVMKIERNMDTEENKRERERIEVGNKIRSKRSRNNLDRVLMLPK
jgi:hypothetical protein